MDFPQSNLDITYNEKENMISISELTTNIKDVSMWIDKDCVRVSNIPNNKKGENCFSIKIPSLIVTGYVDNKFITGEKMNKILSFIQNNVTYINMYFNNEFDTSIFLKNIKNNFLF